MTFYEAAVEVLRDAGRALNYKKITEIAIKRDLLSHVGKRPEETMGHRLLQEVKKSADSTLIRAVRPGVYTLRDGVDPTEAKETINLHPAPEEPEVEENVEVEAEAAEAAEDADAPTDPTDDAEAASGDEDSDATEAAADDEGGGRSRRRRSRRGRGRRRDRDDSDDDEGDDAKAVAAGDDDADANDDDSADDGDSDANDDDGADDNGTESARADNDDDDNGRRGDRRRRRRGRRGGRGRRREEGDEDGDQQAAAPAPAPVRPVQRPIPLVHVPSTRERDPVGDIARAASEILGRRDDGGLSIGRLARDLSKSGVGSLGVLGGSIIRTELERANADRAADGRPPMFEEVKPNHWSVAQASGTDLAASYTALDEWQSAHRKVLGKTLMARVSGLEDEVLGSVITLLLDRMGYRDLTQLDAAGDEVATISASAPRGLTHARVAVRVFNASRVVTGDDVKALRDALEGHGATEGAIIALSAPKTDAVSESERIGAAQVALIGPEDLAELLLEQRVGVRTIAVEVGTLDESVLRDMAEPKRR